MKKFLVKIIILLFLILIVYIGIFSIKKINKGNIIIVEDLRINRVVRILNNNYNFVWEGAFPWWFTVYEMPSKVSILFDLKIPVSPLENLKGDFYSVKVPIKAVYDITEKFYDLSSLINNGEKLNSFIQKSITGSFSKEFNIYFSPIYKNDVLYSKKDEILTKVFAHLKGEFQGIGLDLKKLEYAGNMYLPDIKIYNEGTIYMAELRKLEEENERQMKLLKIKLEKEKILNEETYKKLYEISKIIKQNPDILKYIYIDKMAGNVKVILSSDSSGIPKIFDTMNNEPRSSRKKDIDNLR